jgi:putative intracellular protease/amidase
MRSVDQALTIARKVMESKFPLAQLAFCAGSIVRGEGTDTSDIDLVVLFPSLKQAWRESLTFEGWPVEAFVHDPGTLHYFFKEVDAKSGVPSLPQMVHEGHVVWGKTEDAASYKKLATEIIRQGPPQLSQDDIRNLIYGISDLIDDLRAPRSREEAIGIAVRLYEVLGDFALRSNGFWSGNGKQVSRALERQIPQLFKDFTSAFEEFFSRGNTAGVISLAEKIVAPLGGFLFDGYRRTAPTTWRMDQGPANKDQTASRSIVAILYPGCIFFELALALELLAKKYSIVFASPDGTDHQASNGSAIKVSTSYENIDLENCAALLIPGGDPGSINDNTALDEIVRTANSKGIWLAAICAGPSLLAKAGVLKGRKVAHGYGPKQLEFLKSYFEGAHLTDEKFACDGNIITAKPEAHIDFAVEIASRLQATDASKANRTKDYYKGILGTKIRPLAIALIQNSRGQFLFDKGRDKIKNESFYRPLGGGMEFSESGNKALAREIVEELNQAVDVLKLVASLENIFTYEGQPGHETVMLFSAKFKDSDAYNKPEFDIYEGGVVVGKAVWRSLEEIRTEGAKLYPNGLEQIISTYKEGP